MSRKASLYRQVYVKFSLARQVAFEMNWSCENEGSYSEYSLLSNFEVFLALVFIFPTFDFIQGIPIGIGHRLLVCCSVWFSLHSGTVFKPENNFKSYCYDITVIIFYVICWHYYNIVQFFQKCWTCTVRKGLTVDIGNTQSI